MHQEATRDLLACVRFAGHLSKLQNRKVALPGFVGSPAHCWSHWFLFPPLPTSLEGHAIPDVREVSLELLVERFGPVLDLCKQYGVTFDLECHPSERAMGDLESANDYLKAMDKAGYADVVGFNLDGSHLEWQNVSVIQFIREFGERIHCAHVKGVWVAPRALPRRPARRPPADGPLDQRLELRHRRHRPRRQQPGRDLHRAESRRLRRGRVASSGRTTTPSSTPGRRRPWPTAARPTTRRAACGTTRC